MLFQCLYISPLVEHRQGSQAHSSMAQEGSLKSRIKTATPCIMQHACCNVCTAGECGRKGGLTGDNVHYCPGTSSQYSCVPNASSFFPSTSRIQPLALSTFVSHLLVSVLTLFRLRILPFSEICIPLSVLSSQWFESDVQAVLSVAIISTGQGQTKCLILLVSGIGTESLVAEPAMSLLHGNYKEDPECPEKAVNQNEEKYGPSSNPYSDCNSLPLTCFFKAALVTTIVMRMYFEIQFSSSGTNLGVGDMSWECILCRHVPRLNVPRHLGNTDSEIIIQWL